MFKSLSPKIKSLILDMDGVLWKGDQPIGDLPLIFDFIKSIGFHIIFATNNSTRDVSMYIDKLLSFGVNVQPEQIINSSMVTINLLREKFPKGGPVYIIGEKGLISSLESNGFYFDDHDVDAVIVGMDRGVNYEKIGKAAQFIRSGVPFYGTNPDLTFPTPKGIMPGAGAILAAIEAASGVKAIIAGKPSPAIFKMAVKRLGTKESETLVIGDRLETDILGGQSAGCKTALVLSGVTSREEVEKWEPKPDIVSENLSMLLGLL